MATETKYKVGDKVFYISYGFIHHGIIKTLYREKEYTGYVVNTGEWYLEEVEVFELFMAETLPDLIKQLTDDFITKYPNVETD
jgi:hypothetical protein